MAAGRRKDPGSMAMRSGAVVKRRRLANGAFVVAFSLLSLVFLVPIVMLVLTALRSDPDFLTHGVFSLPQSFRLANISDAWQTGDFGTTYKNSALITVVKVPLGLLISALAAYPLAKMQFRLRGLIFIFFVAGLTVPIHVALLPLFVLDRNMGLLGSLWALLGPYIGFGIPFQVFVLRGFMRLIPNELMEAARIDGAGDLTVFTRVLLPLIAPALATLCIIDAVATWNEFLMALVLLPSADVHTLPLGLLNFFDQYSGSYTLLSAGIVVSVLPLLIVYVFLQRFLVGGLVGGAIKG
jgi:raffinose/stachyose/melibiose transport system permease protein